MRRRHNPSAAAPRETESKGPYFVAAGALLLGGLAWSLWPRSVQAQTPPAQTTTQVLGRLPRPAWVDAYQPAPLDGATLQLRNRMTGVVEAPRWDGRTPYKEVATFQWQLNQMTGAPPEVDGVWGGNTTRAIRAFYLNDPEAFTRFEAAPQRTQRAVALNDVDAAYRRLYPAAAGDAWGPVSKSAERSALSERARAR